MQFQLNFCLTMDCFSLCVVGLHMLDCRCLPVHLVLLGPCMYRYAILHIVSHHCSFCVHLVQVFFRFLQCRHCHYFRHGTWYTTPFFFHFGWGSFVCTKASLSVSSDLKVVLMPRLLHFLSLLSLTSLTFGKWRNLGVVYTCSSVWVEGGGRGTGWFLRVWFTICAEYPFA